jgi:TP901 family phage tail tape measure protein
MAGERTFGVVITARVDSYVAAMERAKSSTASFSKDSAANLQRVGQSMQNVGGKLTTRVTLPLLAAGAGAVKLASDFDTAFTRMVNLAGVTADEVDGLKKSVLDLASKTGQAPQKLADGLYAAKSAGLDTAHAMDAVTVAAQAAAVGMGDVDAIVGLVASAMASYGAANITAAQATDILTAAVRDGRADPAELAGSLGSLLPIASALGVSFGQVGGTVAYLSNIMGDTGRTVTGLRGVLTKLYAPSAQGQQALKDMGTSAGELKASIDQNGLLGALDLLRTHGFATNSQAAHKLFDDIDALSAATALMNDKSGTLNSTIQDVTNSSGALGTAFDQTSKSAGFKMKQAWADLQVALIKAGDIILPIVSKVAGAVGALAAKFADLPRPVQTIIVAFAGLLAAVGPVVLILGSVIKNMALIRGVAASASGSMTGFSTAVGYASLAIGGLLATKQLLNFLDNLQGRTGDATKAIQSFLASTTALGAGSQGTADMANSFADLATSIQKTESSLDAAGALLNGGGDAGFNLDSMKKAFDAVIGQSPQMAKQLTTDLQQVSDAADGGSQSARDWMAGWGLSKDVIAGWTAQADNAIGAQKALTDATGAAVDPTQTQTDTTEDLDAATKQAKVSVADLTRGMELTEAQSDATSKALQRATAAAQAQADAFEADLKAQLALVDFARGLADAQYALGRSTDAYAKFLEDLPAQIKEVNKSHDSQAEKQREINELYRSGTDAATKMADDTVAAYQQAAGGTLTATQKLDIWNQSALQQAALASGPLRKSILDYVATTNTIPPNVATYISALIDQGRIDEANQLLADTSKPRDAAVLADADTQSIADTKDKLTEIQTFANDLNLDIPVDANTDQADAAIAAMESRWTKLAATFHLKPGDVGYMRSAAGRYVPGGSNILTSAGEQGPEAILPLDQPGRLRELLSDARIGGPIAAIVGKSQAGGASQMSSGGDLSSLAFMRDLHDNEMLSTGDFNDYLVKNGFSWQDAINTMTPPDASVAATDKSTQDDVMSNRYQQGNLSGEDYAAYLDKRQGEEEQYSNAQTALWSKAEQVRADMAKAEQDRQDAAQKARDDDLAAQDQKMAAEHELGLISNADYETYLLSRQQSYEKYSTAWMAIWQTIQGMHQQEADAAKQAAQDIADAAKQAADAAAAGLAAQVKAAQAQKDLLDASDANNAASWAYDEAAVANYWTSQNGAATQDQRDSAAQTQAQDAQALADAAYRFRDAQANASGFDDYSSEWNKMMRENLTLDRDWSSQHNKPDVAAALDRYLVGIPSFAHGGYADPRPGGAVVRVAEAGQREWMLPNDRYMALQSMAAGGSRMASWQPSMQFKPAPVTVNADVRVFVGDREITDIVRTEIDVYDKSTAAEIMAGKR